MLNHWQWLEQSSAVTSARPGAREGGNAHDFVTGDWPVIVLTFARGEGSKKFYVWTFDKNDRYFWLGNQGALRFDDTKQALCDFTHIKMH